MSPPTFDRTMLFIVRVVAERFGVMETEILSASHARRAAYPRFVVMALARDITGLGVKAIGLYLKRDRTTIEHGLRRIDRLVRADPSIRELVDTLRDRCRAGLTVHERAEELFNRLARDLSATDPVELIQRVARLAGAVLAPGAALAPVAATEPPWGFGPPRPATADPSPVESAAPQPIAPQRAEPHRPTPRSAARKADAHTVTPLVENAGASDFGIDARSSAERLAAMNVAHLDKVRAAGVFGHSQSILAGDRHA